MKRFTHKYLLICFLLSVFLFPRDSYSEFNIAPFVGLSGTSFAVFLAETVLDADGKIVEAAGEYGLLTGEIGGSLDFNVTYLGLRLEGLAGYYKYKVFDLPNTAYMMYMVGAEPYVKIGPVILGGGAGLFYGYLWHELLGYEASPYREHRGFAVWGTTGLKFKSVELNMRVRWHHFSEIDEEKLQEYEGEDYEDLSDDYVFVLRFCYFLKIL
jgi:hypothetical protein